jgi:hypothetical protein
MPVSTEQIPRLIARFETDAEGKPRFTQDSDKRHYRLVFEIENAPPDAYAATFELHPTYYDPVRTVTADQDGKIRLETSSYGDYLLKVLLRTKKGEIPIADTVSHALQKSHATANNPALDQALADIEGH